MRRVAYNEVGLDPFSLDYSKTNGVNIKVSGSISHTTDVFFFPKQKKILGLSHAYFEVWNLRNGKIPPTSQNKIMVESLRFDYAIKWNDTVFLGCGKGCIFSFSIVKCAPIRRVLYRRKSAFFYMLKLSDNIFLCADSFYNEMLVIEYSEKVKVLKKCRFDDVKFSDDFDNESVVHPSKFWKTAIYITTINDYYSDTIKLVDYYNEGRVLRKYRKKGVNINHIANFINKKHEEILLCASNEGNLYFYNTAKEGTNNYFKKLNMGLRIGALLEIFNRFLFVGYDDGKLKILNLETCEELIEKKIYGKVVRRNYSHQPQVTKIKLIDLKAKKNEIVLSTISSYGIVKILGIKNLLRKNKCDQRKNDIKERAKYLEEQFFSDYPSERTRSVMLIFHRIISTQKKLDFNIFKSFLCNS